MPTMDWPSRRAYTVGDLTIIVEKSPYHHQSQKLAADQRGIGNGAVAKHTNSTSANVLDGTFDGGLPMGAAT